MPGRSPEDKVQGAQTYRFRMHRMRSEQQPGESRESWPQRRHHETHSGDQDTGGGVKGDVRGVIPHRTQTRHQVVEPEIRWKCSSY